MYGLTQSRVGCTRGPRSVLEGLVEEYSLDRVERVHPGFTEAVGRGLDKLREMTLDVAQLFSELLWENRSVDEWWARTVVSTVKEALERGDTRTYTYEMQGFRRAPGIEVSLPYYLGRYGGVPGRESLRRRLREYITVLKGMLGGGTEPWLERLERIARSPQIISKGLTTLMYLDVLVGSGLLEALLGEAEKRGFKRQLLNRVMDCIVWERVVEEYRGFKRYTRRVVEPAPIDSFITAIDILEAVGEALKLIYGANAIKEVLEGKGLPLRFGGCEVEVAVDGDSVKLTLREGGGRTHTVTVPWEEINYLVAMGELEAALGRIAHAYKELLWSAGYEVASSEDTTLIYRFTDEGVEVVHPEVKVYTWSSLPEFIGRYGRCRGLGEAVYRAKHEARLRGYDYPETPTLAVKWVYRSQTPKIWIVEDVDGRVYLLVKGGGDGMETVLEANGIDEFRRELREVIESGRLEAKYAAKLIHWLRSQGVEVDRVCEELVRIRRLTGVDLVGENGVYTTPDHTLTVVRDDSGSSLAVELRGLAERHATPVDPSNVRVVLDGRALPLGEVGVREARKMLHRGYVEVEAGGARYRYSLAYMLPLLKRKPPRRMYVVEGGVAVLEYPGYRVYVAPST